jgi:hypothetical protein
MDTDRLPGAAPEQVLEIRRNTVVRVHLCKRMIAPAPAIG